ncbi:hypothetical protein DITRI_Ditri11bG0180400 [Diplodiscus trichospermus]
MHSQASLTVIRFLPTTSSRHNSWINDASHKDEKVIMAISNVGTKNEIDNAFVETFYNRYVAQGKAVLVEKYVSEGMETVAALKRNGREVFIVYSRKGRGREQPIDKWYERVGRVPRAWVGNGWGSISIFRNGHNKWFHLGNPTTSALRVRQRPLR